MLLTRNQFFILLFVLLIGPFIVYKLVWLANSKQSKGMAYFMGHTLELDGSISSHIVILFKAGKDSVTFNAPTNLGYKPGDSVPIRFPKDNPAEAKVDVPLRIWGDTIVYSLLPLLILFVLFLTPDRLDPLIPKKSKIYLGKKPFVKIVSPTKN